MLTVTVVEVASKTNALEQQPYTEMLFVCPSNFAPLSVTAEVLSLAFKPMYIFPISKPE